jgi:hypothetical protein
VNFLVQYNGGNILTSTEAVNFSRRTLFHGITNLTALCAATFVTHHILSNFLPDSNYNTIDDVLEQQL